MFVDRGAVLDHCVIATPIGCLTVATVAGAVSGIAFAQRHARNTATDLTPRSAIAERTSRQLERYFDDPDWCFRLPLAPAGTNFQRQVWATLLKTRAGQTLSYGNLAVRVQSGPRAVGNACGRNPLPIIIPCHRVITASGELGGFCRARNGAFMLGKKRWLLAHEQGSTPLRLKQPLR